MHTIPAERKQVLSDWHNLLPFLGTYRKQHLFRLVGPLVQGISLEFGSSHYRPTAHLHNLCCEQSGMSLMLYMGRESITYTLHNIKHKRVAIKLVEEYPLSFQGNLHINDVVDAYRAFARSPAGARQVALYEEMATLLAYGGRLREAESVVGEGVDAMRSWPSQILEWTEGSESWAERVLQRISKKQVLRDVVQAEMLRHKLGKLPISELIYS